MNNARIAFQYPDFRFYLISRFLGLAAHQMLIVAISQYIYELTHNPLDLGYIGLAIFLPKFSFTLIAGHSADRFDRRRVILISRMAQFLIVTAMAIAVLNQHPLWILYSLLFMLGTAYAFDGPASHSLVPQLVPIEHFSNAVAWNSSAMQIAFIAGPALGGILYAATGKALYVILIVAALRLASALLIKQMKIRTGRLEKSDLSWHTVLAGLRYVFEKKIILGAISLDLFAVLLGGAVALMPVFANDILKVGPTGLGLLRASPALGAALMAIALAHLPPLKRAGLFMFCCVAIFGIATLLFGLSRNFYFSLFCLFVLGAADMVSVVIRGVLVQMKTPQEMRGRVSAVNLIFIGASNELGEFESGLTASWFGTVPAVILGGIGTLLVVGIWSWKFPELRKYNSLDEDRRGNS